MLVKFILQLLLPMLVMIVFITQLLIPVLTGTKTWPIFNRRRARLERAALEALEHKEDERWRDTVIAIQNDGEPERWNMSTAAPQPAQTNVNPKEP